MLLGIVSLRAGQKTPGDSKIHYDGASMRVTNTIKGPGGTVTDPNEFLRREIPPAMEADLTRLFFRFSPDGGRTRAQDSERSSAP